jgi:hypothetical protein
MGAWGRWPVLRGACAPAQPAGRRHDHHPVRTLRPADARGLWRATGAAMAPNAGMGYPTVSSVSSWETY